MRSPTVDGAGPPGERITVVVNGEHVQVRRGATVADVVAGLSRGLSPDGRGVAVAVGREIVPRSAWASVRVDEGSVLEVVTAAAGG
ncbi:MAG: sulfur carrier protein ThiS [Acidimicrobiales bacterium]